MLEIVFIYGIVLAVVSLFHAGVWLFGGGDWDFWTGQGGIAIWPIMLLIYLIRGIINAVNQAFD